MNLCQTLAEVLYIISNYEKGRLSEAHPWSIKTICEIKESVTIMQDILNCFNNIKSNDSVLRIVKYVKKKEGIVFRELDDMKFNQFTTVLQSNCICDTIEYKKIIELMQEILYQLSIILKTFFINKNKRRSICIYFRAFHNLPLAMLDNKESTLFNIAIGNPYNISIMYAEQWLNKLDTMK